MEKKINPNQRERILELASKEFSYEGTLEQRIQKIEERLFLQNADEHPEGNSENSVKRNETLIDLGFEIAEDLDDVFDIEFTNEPETRVVKALKEMQDNLGSASDVHTSSIENNEISNSEIAALDALFGYSSQKAFPDKIEFKGINRAGMTNGNLKYIDPYNLYEFLFEYNQNPVLKYTCHDIDEDALTDINDRCATETYEFPEHLKIIIEEFEKHSKKHFAPKITPLIRGYLTGKNYQGETIKSGWSTDKIIQHWSSKELFKWAEQNQGIPPNWNEDIAEKKDVELFPIQPQIKSPISYEPIQNFTQLVLHFKNLFHIKYGRQSLKAILKRVNKSKEWDDVFDIEFKENKFPDNLEHFTSVNKVTEAYNRLLLSIKKKHDIQEKPKIELSFYVENNIVYLSIHHINGVFKKTIQNTLERPGDMLSKLLKNQINGLCNLILRADFGSSQYAEINLWNGKKRSVKKLSSFHGVQFLLEFPKIKST